MATTSTGTRNLLKTLENDMGKEDLVGFWKLAGDCSDYSGSGLHGINKGAVLDKDGALFDGREALIEVPHSSPLDFGSEDFTISISVHTEKILDDLPGDILCKYDTDTRNGINFSLLTNSGVTAAQANYRHLHFGMDAGIDSGWIDCGRPGNNLRVYSLCVFEGDLYAGTFETGANEMGHVYRYSGGTEWVDCGSPDKCNTIASLCVFEGALYAGSSRYKAGGSALPDSENLAPGGNMYRYEGGRKWAAIGNLQGADSCAGMAVYNGNLYAIPLYSQGIFRYDGDSTWTSVGTPGRRLMSLAVFNGSLYGAGNEGEKLGGVFRYEGGAEWSYAGGQENVTQVYSFASHYGKLYVGTWPEGKVFRDDGEDPWTCVGQLGQEKEVMAMSVYNGKLYAGTLPLGEVYRYDGGTGWTNTGQLDKSVDVKYRRVWSMATFQGKLFAGTLPSGHVYGMETGTNVTLDSELSPGWRNLGVVRSGNQLTLYVDGMQVSRSDSFNSHQVEISNTSPLRIGSGTIDGFKGRIRDLRIHRRALTGEEIADLHSG